MATIIYRNITNHLLRLLTCSKYLAKVVTFIPDDLYEDYNKYIKGLNDGDLANSEYVGIFTIGICGAIIGTKVMTWNVFINRLGIFECTDLVMCDTGVAKWPPVSWIDMSDDMEYFELNCAHVIFRYKGYYKWLNTLTPDISKDDIYKAIMLWSWMKLNSSNI